MRLELVAKASTRELARRMATVVAAGDLIVLGGPLGSGKTFFARALCRALGLPRTVRVPSPTFTLVHEYDTVPPLCHADVYRLVDAGQVAELGLDAQRDEGRVLLVEWGQPYAELLGGDALLVQLGLDPRHAHLSASGSRSEQMLLDLKRCYQHGNGSE